MSTSVHPVDETLPLGQLTALGLQHVLVMYAGAVAVPLIVGRALNLPPGCPGKGATETVSMRGLTRNRPALS